MAAADAIGIADWLERVDRGEWFTAADPELQALQVLAITHGASTRQVLGVSQGERAMTTLRNLLALAGYRLEAKQNGRKGTASGFIEWWPNHSAGRGRPVQ